MKISTLMLVVTVIGAVGVVPAVAQRAGQAGINAAANEAAAGGVVHHHYHYGGTAVAPGYGWGGDATRSSGVSPE